MDNNERNFNKFMIGCCIVSVSLFEIEYSRSNPHDLIGNIEFAVALLIIIFIFVLSIIRIRNAKKFLKQNKIK